MRLRLVTVAIVSALFGAGVGVGIMAWEPWESDSSAEPGPLLTGGEAADKAEEYLYSLDEGPGPPKLNIYCDDEDYNSRTRTWIVVCELDNPDLDERPGKTRVQVDDRTGEASFLK